jgi:hypothetical protein
LLYQDLIKAKQLPKDGKLPPVLPIVLYNGVKPWDAAEELDELIETVPPGLEAYRPSLRYLLLDEGRFSEAELTRLPPLATRSRSIFDFTGDLFCSEIAPLFLSQKRSPVKSNLFAIDAPRVAEDGLSR